MQKVNQTKFGAEEGNCFAACIASLLHIPIEGIPVFGDDPNKNWVSRFEEWLRPRGLAPVIFHGQGLIIPNGVHYLAGGESVRKIPHSVIYLDGQLVHDPFPGGSGLEGAPTDYTFLVPLQPERIKPLEEAGTFDLTVSFPTDKLMDALPMLHKAEDVKITHTDLVSSPVVFAVQCAAAKREALEQAVQDLGGFVRRA